MEDRAAAVKQSATARERVPPGHSRRVAWWRRGGNERLDDGINQLWEYWVYRPSCGLKQAVWRNPSQLNRRTAGPARSRVTSGRTDGTIEREYLEKISVGLVSRVFREGRAVP